MDSSRELSLFFLELSVLFSELSSKWVTLIKGSVSSSFKSQNLSTFIGFFLALVFTANWNLSCIPAEVRTTVGGYHLLRGIPIERTEIARDPHSPIFESHLPTLLKSQILPEYQELIGQIELKTVMKGAGPILQRINELVQEGKKLIIADAVSTVDIEQVALAIKKSDYKILPSGTAAFAQALSEYWFANLESEHIIKTFPRLPKLIISGSATQITANQIEKLEDCDEFDDILSIRLDLKTVLEGVKEELVDRVVSNLRVENAVIVHTSNLINEFDGFSEDSLNAELTKTNLAEVITDFLAELTRRVLAKKEAILITLGGETSYKCCSAIGAYQLQLIDEVAPAIALSLDHNAQWIVTKSGNLGNANTLIDILRYFETHGGLQDA